MSRAAALLWCDQSQCWGFNSRGSGGDCGTSYMRAGIIFGSSFCQGLHQGLLLLELPGAPVSPVKMGQLFIQIHNYVLNVKIFNHKGLSHLSKKKKKSGKIMSVPAALQQWQTHGVSSLLQIGWMMWNWLVSALATGASLVLYDGSPLIPSPNVLWDLTDRLGYVLRVVAVAPVTLTQAAPLCAVLLVRNSCTAWQFIFWLSLGWNCF